MKIQNTFAAIIKSIIMPLHGKIWNIILLVIAISKCMQLIDSLTKYRIYHILTFLVKHSKPIYVQMVFSIIYSNKHSYSKIYWSWYPLVSTAYISTVRSTLYHVQKCCVESSQGIDSLIWHKVYRIYSTFYPSHYAAGESWLPSLCFLTHKI